MGYTRKTKNLMKCQLKRMKASKSKSVSDDDFSIDSRNSEHKENDIDTDDWKRKVAAAAEELRSQMNRLVLAEYAGWNWQECLAWTMSLENGRFQKYEELLRVALSATDATGKDLEEVTSFTLKGMGIMDAEDRTALVGHIRALML